MSPNTPMACGVVRPSSSELEFTAGRAIFELGMGL